MPSLAPLNSAVGYRKDVDGLRAIAVLSVIFFHLNPAWAPGGFVGVDMFFVISGYLITGQIRNDLAQGTFSIGNFYLRRIRRIVPPLLVMLCLTSFFAWLILKPEDLRSYVYSLIVQPFSLQNFFFLSEGDYFRGGETKALLHTWSLAVEEQFYLFWPVFLLLLTRHKIKPLIGIFIVVIAASFFLNVSVTSSNSKAAFYLIFTRAWELAFGGLAHLLEEYQETDSSSKRNELLEWASALGIGCAILFIRADMQFPGKVALAPVLAAFITIANKNSYATAFGKFLSSRLLVQLGLISYPLYLWHWPILVFMRHLQISPKDPLPMLCFWVMTFGPAYASFHWIESPIRCKTWLRSPRGLITAMAVTFGVLAVFSVHVLITDGASYRYNPKAQAFLTASIQSYTKRCDVSAILADPRSEICKLRYNASDQHKILLWGNSHASMLIPMLKQLAETHSTSLFVNTQNCRPMVEPNACSQNVQASILKKIEDESVTGVIFASSWQDINKPELFDQFTETVRWLSERNIQVWLVVDSPTAPDFDPVVALAKNPDDPQPGTIPIETYNKNSRLAELITFQRLQSQYRNVHIIDSSSVLCDLVQCVAGQGNEVWYRDSGHLNNAGALAISAFFEPAFNP